MDAEPKLMKKDCPKMGQSFLQTEVKIGKVTQISNKEFSSIYDELSRKYILISFTDTLSLREAFSKKYRLIGSLKKASGKGKTRLIKEWFWIYGRKRYEKGDKSIRLL